MIKTLSFFETLTFNALYSIPNYLQGLFTRRRFWLGLFTRLQIDRFAIRFLSNLRRRLKSEYFFTRVGNSNTLLVLNHDGIRHILEHSPRVYADAESKRRGMSHFQPSAVTISRGAAWIDRREFNEAVLNTGRPIHEHADRFLEIVTSATHAMNAAAGPRITWSEFDALFEDIAAGVIFGGDSRTTRPMYDRLIQMMRESNRVFGLKKSKHFDVFYEEIRAQMAAPQNHSLVAACPHAPSTPTTRVENQIPHWMFAIRETLAANTVRALALILSHPASEERVRDELVWSDRLTPAVVENLRYLEACVQEAMRLWPTTPFIAREVLTEDMLENSAILPGTQVLIANTFNHRDREANPEADTFCPEQWLEGRPPFPYNHLSSGAQVCAGKDLALFIAKAALASMLKQRRYVLRKPRLNSRKPLPSMYNYFRVSVSTR